MTPAPECRRIAVISVHTSPLAQPGTGDAGGMNVYVLRTAEQLARRGVEVEIFSRATSSSDEPVVQAAPGVWVRNVVAGPFEGLDKAELPTQLCPFTAGVLRVEARHEPGYFDLIHSHYWLSGQVGWLARDRWSVPLVHTAHTLAAVKNAALAEGDSPEPAAREIGERQLVREADRLIANTAAEAEQLIKVYSAVPEQVDVVAPGADLDTYFPASKAAARAELGLDPDEIVVSFVGRIQPLKAPDVLVRAVGDLPAALRDKVRVLIVGGLSGTGRAHPEALDQLVRSLGIADRVTFLAPVPPARLAQIYRASDAVAVPSYSESFGLVAIEAQACGTPVIAAAVGGLQTAVRDRRTGVLVRGHRIDDWSAALTRLLGDPGLRATLGRAAAVHAAEFSWDRTADGLLASYRRALATSPFSAHRTDALGTVQRGPRQRIGVRR